jgi:hypothetical protein
LTLLGKAHPFRGSIDPAGQAVFGPKASQTYLLKRPGAPNLELQFLIDQDFGTFKVNGWLTQRGAPFSEIRGDRALFTAGDANAPFRHPAAEMLGSYEVVFGQQTYPATFPVAAETKGTGSLTLSPNGVATLIATLSDGTRISYRNFVSIDGKWPFYVPLNRGGGSLSGLVSFRHLDEGSDLDAQTIHWFHARHWPFLTELDLLGTKSENASGR